MSVGRPAVSSSEWTSHLRQLLFAVTEVIDVDDRHLVEREHGPLLHATQDDGIQLGVVVQQGAVDLQPQQVGGEVDVLDARGKLARLGCQHLSRLSRPQHLPSGREKGCNVAPASEG